MQKRKKGFNCLQKLCNGWTALQLKLIKFLKKKVCIVTSPMSGLSCNILKLNLAIIYVNLVNLQSPQTLEVIAAFQEHKLICRHCFLMFCDGYIFLNFVFTVEWPRSEGGGASAPLSSLLVAPLKITFS